jgi:hypothetical protein
MNELLEIALKAHGGLERWRKVKSIQVDASITGAIWFVKGKPDVLNNVFITAETPLERLTMDLRGQGKRTIFEPDHITVVNDEGELIEEKADPRKSFEGQTLKTPWNDVHVAYFSGEAMWSYLNIPFLYAQPGFENQEVVPIQSGGETWMRLKVTIPDSVKSHTRTQFSCFGSDGLLRRHDYTVDILGGSQGLNYAHDYATCDGIVFPLTRKVVGYQGDYQPIMDPVLVDIRMKNLTLT